MKINISTEYPIKFVLDLRKYLVEALTIIIRQERLEYYYKKENIDLLKLLIYTISNLKVMKNAREYTLYIDPYMVYNGNNLVKLLNKITYGTRTLKGYPILEELFKYTQANINVYYDRWAKDGY